MGSSNCAKRLLKSRYIATLLGVIVLLAAVGAESASARTFKSRNKAQSLVTAVKTTTAASTVTSGTMTNRPGKRGLIFRPGKPGDGRTSQSLPVKPKDPPTSGTLQTPAQFETRWLKSNIDLHNRMLALAKTESEQTTSTELKTFSLDLQTSLGLEVAQMKGWLKSWYNIGDTSTTLPPRGTCDPFVGPTGNKDLMFLMQVASYENATIGAAGFPASMAAHAELKVFADQMSAEGREVLALVSSWRDLLIKMSLEDFFQKGSTQPPWGK